MTDIERLQARVAMLSGVLKKCAAYRREQGECGNSDLDQEIRAALLASSDR